MARAGYTDWIWIPFFRRCWIGPDKVEVTHPIIFGRGFLFDRAKQVVTIRRYLLGLPLSTKEIPFSELTMGKRKIAFDAGPYGGSVNYSVDISARGQRFHTGFTGNERAFRVLTAIRRLVGRLDRE